MMLESGRTEPVGTAAERCSDSSLLRYLQGVIHFNDQVATGTFQLGVSQEQLNGPQVLGALVDQRRFGSPHRVRPVCRWIQARGFGPVMHEPRVLAG